MYSLHQYRSGVEGYTELALHFLVIDGSQIVCQDNNFVTTTPGQKFKACIACLQLSTATGHSQNDQKWFMYNLRYSLASCLYGFDNATDPTVTPCSTSRACGPFQGALEDGNLEPDNETAYRYCGTDYASMMGSTTACRSCLRNGGTETYLSNSKSKTSADISSVVTALQAGCHQQPPDGTIIGLNASVFSQYAIDETSPGDNYNKTAISTGKFKHLDKNSIIGISFGLSAVLLASIFMIFLLWKTSRRPSRNRNLHSPLDERYRDYNITAPVAGAFGISDIQTRTISLAPPPRTRNKSQSIFKKSLSDDYNFTDKTSISPPQLITSPHGAHLTHPPPAYTFPQDRSYPRALLTEAQPPHLFTSPAIPQRNPSRCSHLSPSDTTDRNITSHARGSIAGTQHSAIKYRNSIVSTATEIGDLKSPPPVGSTEFGGGQHARMTTGTEESRQRSSSRAKGRSRERFNGHGRETSRERMNGPIEREWEMREREWNAARLGKINGRDGDGEEEEQWPGSF
ncbi:exo-alpha-sialidase neuraminidase protein [Rutstroemia sp. NJR-2017a BVV2]|nr:exo-alpha-sialidase neuraminidase protein [Rutstroemia sp. NJR-2017a BVV2]